MTGSRNFLKSVARPFLFLVAKIWPLESRKSFVVWSDRKFRSRLSAKLSLILLEDFRAQDPKELHKFFWAHHLFEYGRPYESLALYKCENLEPSRVLFFSELRSVVDNLPTLNRNSGVSVLEIGCSLGHLLRFIETDVFPNAERIVGLDIDRAALEAGRRHLDGMGSKVVLKCGDMEQLDSLLGVESFDVSIAAGVLTYLDEPDASRVVEKLFRRTKKLVALAGLAHKSVDNGNLNSAELSPERYNQWVHNFDAMVHRAGGKVIARRWEGPKVYGGQTIYFVFAVPDLRTPHLWPPRSSD